MNAPVLKVVSHFTDGAPKYISFKCPGCGDRHTLGVRDNRLEGPKWHWNGSVDKPTLKPSIDATSGHYCKHYVKGTGCWCTYRREDGEPSPFSCCKCHSFVTDGKIRFLEDSTHAMAGQTVDLPPYTEEDQQ
jgi:hypothetical protein